MDGNNRKRRPETVVGLLIVALYISLNEFVDMPDFLGGLMLGGGIALELLGVMSDEKRRNMKKFKRNMILKITK